MTRASARLQTITVGINLITETCCSCGVLFAMSEELYNRKQSQRGETFYCPNGHGQHYTGESDKARAERLAKALEREQQARGDEQREATRLIAAQKGQVTKLRKRVAAGVCPFGCRRHFVNVERHVASQHTGQQLDGES